MAVLSPEQHRAVISLYRQALRQGRLTFKDDSRVISAWCRHVRNEFSQELPPAKEGPDPVDMKIKEWEGAVKYLRHNIVQGARQDSGAYRLRITKDTELGNNDDIKKAKKQLVSSGVGCCGGGGGGSRAFSTMARRPQASTSALGLGSARTFATSAPAFSRPTKLLTPRPVSKYLTTIIQNDGSSFEAFTSSPRTAMRLTRDPTNHPLWNPLAERSTDLGVSVSTEGQLGRFQKKYSMDDFAFEQDDLAWMSGGQEASRGAFVAKKAKKGGKKK